MALLWKLYTRRRISELVIFQNIIKRTMVAIHYSRANKVNMKVKPLLMCRDQISLNKVFEGN